MRVMTKRRQPPILLHAAEKMGGMSELARSLECTRQALYQWRRIPADRVIQIERLTNISRQELRPDLYPQEVA